MKKKVFIIDDDVFFTDLISEILNKKNYLVQCSNEPENINLEYLQQFDVLILDLIMPKINGLVILDLICNLKNPPLIVLISGSDFHEIEKIKSWAVGMGLKIHGILKKPFMANDLLKII